MKQRGASGRKSEVLSFPESYRQLTAEQALRAAIDTQVFAALRELESLDGGRAVQAVYVSLVRRIPNVRPDRKRIAIDCGFSVSSVKRAIKLLERCALIDVRRQKGKSSVYVVTDLRVVEAASASLSGIRRLAREGTGEKQRRGRTIGEPGQRGSRVGTDPTGGVSSEPELGSQVAQKEARKKQNKQQDVACLKGNVDSAVCEALRRWGLGSATYLVTPGHRKAIPLLVQRAALAARLIDATMAGAKWSDGAGVGARVAYLREHVEGALGTRAK